MSLGDMLFFCGEMAGVGSGSKGEERPGDWKEWRKRKM